MIPTHQSEQVLLQLGNRITNAAELQLQNPSG